jgi:hypothetical protein
LKPSRTGAGGGLALVGAPEQHDIVGVILHQQDGLWGTVCAHGLSALSGLSNSTQNRLPLPDADSTPASPLMRYAPLTTMVSPKPAPGRIPA